MRYESNALKGTKGYVPPFVGNGSLTLQTDFEGTMNYRVESGIIRDNSDMRIWWAGRRYLHKDQRDLVSFGFFGQEDMGEVKSFWQELDTENAVSYSECTYSSGRKIKSEVLVHHDMNLIAVKKDTDGEIRFDYTLCDIKDESMFPELMTIENVETVNDGIIIDYNVKAGLYPYDGRISVFADKDVKVSCCDNRYSLMADGEAVFYILLCDSVDYEDYKEKSGEQKVSVLESGYSKVKAEHSRKWQEYYQEGGAVIGDELIDNAYKTAQYHLKCFTTKWSVPVGLNNGSWQGKYFAFDEYYMFMGLITSNHLAAAKKIPTFRADGLPYAVFRGSDPSNRIEAHYPWETLEDGTEGAISGFWYDHIFHMACIPCDEYYYYKYSNDKKFLEETAYPVIKACSRFFLNHAIYKNESGKTIIGKCTDLERLGASRENAYMTTCGVIKTLRIFDEVSGILGVDEDMAKECRDAAEALYEGLPVENGRYVPFPGCETESIAVLSGTYPFDVVDRDSEAQNGGIQSYLDSENVVGNMYAVGKGVCSWYMTWKAVVFARLGRVLETYEAVKNAACNSGFFGEMYEINDMETLTIYRPWFTTAAGMVVHSVNEMLVQCDENMIYLAPALPEDKGDFNFKLAAYEGICVEASVESGSLKKLKLSGAASGMKTKVAVPKHIKICGFEIAEETEKYNIIIK